MARFHFRLETVWKLRVSERQQKQLALTEALRAEQALRGQIEKAVQELETLKAEVRRLSAPGQLNVDQLLRTNRYELVVRAQTAALEHKLTEIMAEAQRRREALIEADRQVRTLEKLRERQLADHVFQEARRESKEMDEVAQRTGPSEV